MVNENLTDTYNIIIINKRTLKLSFMFYNLHKYAELTTRYLLFFVNDSDDQCNEHMVVDFLEDTEVPNFLNRCRTEDEMFLPLTCADQHVSKNNFDVTSETSDSATVGHKISVFDAFCGNRELERNDYIDTTRDHKEVILEIINVPLPKALFQKIIYSSEKKVPKFTLEEICLIIAHFFPLEDKVNIIAYAICVFLQKNSDLVYELKRCDNDASKEKYSDNIKLLTTVVFDVSGSANSFREIVNSYIAFCIKDSTGEIAETVEKNNLSEYICYFINLNELILGFLIKNLTITYNYLINNGYILLDKLGCWPKEFSFNVRVSNITMSSKKTSGDNERLTHKLILLSRCGFLNSKCVKNLTLEFKEITFPVSSSLLFAMKNLSTVQYDLCTADFVNSMPINIDNRQVRLENQSLEAIDLFSKCKVNLQYADFVFESDFNFPHHVKMVKIKNSTIKKSMKLLFNEECDRILIENTSGSINLPRMECFNMIVLKKHKRMFFEFDIRDDLQPKILTIRHANIEGMVCLDQGIDQITLEYVYISFNSQLIFHEDNEHIDISKSAGLMDLTPYIGTELYIHNNMKIRVLPIPYTLLNHIFLCNICTYTCIELGQRNKCATLCKITTWNSARVVINENCTDLEICECNCAIDVTKVVLFDRIKIWFAADGRDNINFIGEVYVTSLEICNVRRCYNFIMSLLPVFKEVSILKFESNYTNESLDGTEQVIYDELRSYLRVKDYDRSSTTSVKRFPSETKRIHRSVYRDVNFAVNRIVNAILDSKITDSIEVLEFKSIVVTKCCYGRFSEFCNLKILKVMVPKVSSGFLSSLPPNLRLLDISNSFNHDPKWRPDYKNFHLSDQLTFGMLRVLVVDTVSLPFIYNISSLMPSLQILKVHFNVRMTWSLVLDTKKVQVCKLIVETKKKIIISSKISKDNHAFKVYLKPLSKYIDLKSLSSLVFISAEEYIRICPFSSKILRRVPRQHDIDLDN